MMQPGWYPGPTTIVTFCHVKLRVGGDFHNLDTPKPWSKGPTFYVFPHLQYIFCAPSQSSICLIYYFPWVTVSQFKDLPTFHTGSCTSSACFGSHFSIEKNFLHAPTCIVQGHRMHSRQCSMAISVHPLRQVKEVTVCSVLRSHVADFLEVTLK
jgi:hypothetical protein